MQTTISGVRALTALMNSAARTGSWVWPSLLVAGMDMDYRGARIRATADIFAHLLGRQGHVRVVSPGRHHAGRAQIYYEARRPSALRFLIRHSRHGTSRDANDGRLGRDIPDGYRTHADGRAIPNREPVPHNGSRPNVHLHAQRGGTGHVRTGAQERVASDRRVVANQRAAVEDRALANPAARANDYEREDNAAPFDEGRRRHDGRRMDKRGELASGVDQPPDYSHPLNGADGGQDREIGLEVSLIVDPQDGHLADKVHATAVQALDQLRPPRQSSGRGRSLLPRSGGPRRESPVPGAARFGC